MEADFERALRCAKVIRGFFTCANGAQIDLTLTRGQVLEIANGCDLDEVYSNEEIGEPEHEPTATWSLSGDGRVLNIHFAT